ncbi:hypothetical protein J2S43_004575 [Catenuloplanes nepalensis]|uniref:Uncharacterized protein n=1 Tax=Catenuloplanes nepalensis TaxID=587533 RepID=A0ABT9MXA6_9ACTN|nr:hypothetical protein [Catenuloplanes nepalensis]
MTADIPVAGTGHRPDLSCSGAPAGRGRTVASTSAANGVLLP